MKHKEVPVEPYSEDDLAALEAAWRTPSGLYGWLATVNHSEIGARFIVTAFGFFILGGILAALIRIQLARPENSVLGPDAYNQIFTMHGTTMMFLFAVPIMEAMGIYLLGGLTLYAFFLLNIGPDVGWFSYVPLAGPEYSPGKRVDIWSQLVNFTEISALAVAVEIITTTFRLRAPGMALQRIPLFVWAMLVTSFMIIFAMPAVMTGSLFLTTDRLVGTQFYNPAEGGDPLLWQHLFWFFGHPEVYIIFIPALGMVSSIVQTFCRRAVFGYTALVLSLLATGFLGFGLWVHHMFATNLPQLGLSFFTAASIVIAIPSGIQIFCWIATLWLGEPIFKTPLLFVFGFIFIFVMGGITGVMLASVPLDLQLHDTFFVVAHFHYVLIGGAVFPLFGSFYYWFPKFTGRLMSERLGRWNFWIMFFGFNIAFFPMHILGLYGMTRRVYTYQSQLGWDSLNLLSSIGAGIFALGVGLFIVNFLVSQRRGAPAGDNPWQGPTLEWAVPSPPPPYNFRYIPVVEGRDGLWDRSESAPVVRGLHYREVLLTSIVDATPQIRRSLPGPTIWPLLLALATTATFIGSCFTPWALPAGVVIISIAAIGWGWPKEAEENVELSLERPPHEPA